VRSDRARFHLRETPSATRHGRRLSRRLEYTYRMSQKASPQAAVVNSAPETFFEALALQFAGRRAAAAIGIAAFVAGAAVMLAYSPLRQMEAGDSAVYDYMAQCIVRGQVPYRDVIDSKGPGSLYISALVMFSGKEAGLQDILAVRIFSVLLVGVLCAITYFVAELYLRSRIAAIIAFSIPLVSEQFAEMMVSGTRPKLPMILFGMTTLLLVARDKPFWAGMCSMLSCLCWQPGLAFTGVAVLMFSRYLTSWRDLRALKVLAGAAVPFVVVIAYFYLAGALGDLWTWTVHYNYTVYMPEANVPPNVALTQVWRLARLALGANIVWVKISIAGLITYAIERLWRRFKERSIVAAPDLFRDALLIPPLVHLGFCVINWQGEESLIPFFPFIGIFAGYFVVAVVRIIIAILHLKRTPLLARVIEWAPMIPLALILVSVVRHARGYQLEPGRTLQDQEMAFTAVSDVLGPDDKLYVHGTVELLVLLHRANMNAYIFLPYGKDEYIGSRLPGGFRAILDEMEAQAPKVIALSRLRTVTHQDDLLAWAAAHYVKIPLEFAHNSVYIRKQE